MNIKYIIFTIIKKYILERAVAECAGERGNSVGGSRRSLEENGGVSVAKAEVFRGNSVDVVEGVSILIFYIEKI